MGTVIAQRAVEDIHCAGAIRNAGSSSQATVASQSCVGDVYCPALVENASATGPRRVVTYDAAKNIQGPTARLMNARAHWSIRSCHGQTRYGQDRRRHRGHLKYTYIHTSRD